MALAAGPPSPENPPRPGPAIVAMLPSGDTFRTRWFEASAMSRPPSRVGATAVGVKSRARVAGPPSPTRLRPSSARNPPRPGMPATRVSRSLESARSTTVAAAVHHQQAAVSGHREWGRGEAGPEHPGRPAVRIDPVHVTAVQGGVEAPAGQAGDLHPVVGPGRPGSRHATVRRPSEAMRRTAGVPVPRPGAYARPPTSRSPSGPRANPVVLIS